MAPDLVLAGSFTAPQTLRMLERLGLRVEVFPPAEKLEDIRTNLLRMGEVLGRGAAAEELVARFDARLEALGTAQAPRPLAALYGANGYSAGDATLPGQMVKAAGFDLLAEELGLPYGGVVPLEILATADPDLLITARPEAPKSRAEEVLAHPVVQRLRAEGPNEVLAESDWICGTPRGSGDGGEAGGDPGGDGDGGVRGPGELEARRCRDGRAPARGVALQRSCGCALWVSGHRTVEVSVDLDEAPARRDGPALARRLRLDSGRGFARPLNGSVATL